MTAELSDLLLELRRHLSALYADRLDRLVLYGSHARGDARLGSDVDVALVLRGAVDPVEEIDWTADVVAGIILDFGYFVSIYPLSVADYVSAERAVICAVREEGIEA